jgi:hypothetical protein
MGARLPKYLELFELISAFRGCVALAEIETGSATTSAGAACT